MSTANAGEYSATQTRTISTALDLFARHGVAGTSLQMIADALGVTKAAVYHQFKTKDEIVLAVADAELARLASVIEAAEAQPSAAQARDELVVRIVDLAVEHRHTLSAILSDPVIARFYGKHEPFRQVMDGLNRVLMGDDAGPDAGVIDRDAHRRDQRRRHAPTGRGPRRRHPAFAAATSRPSVPRHPGLSGGPSATVGVTVRRGVASRRARPARTPGRPRSAC